MPNTPEGNTGKNNTGSFNSGNRNSGNRNSGNRNSGSHNSGNRNSGNRNSGDSNSGSHNSGYGNSGDSNSGYHNSGYRNSGYRNSGNRNSGDSNSGYLNSDSPTVRLFNKDTGIKWKDFNTNIFPDFFWFEYIPTEWISEDNMTEKEKKENPLYNIVGGYLKKLIPNTTSKESKKEWMQKAWRASWDKASDEDRRKVYTLPNWDNEIFKEISGIDVDKELNTPKEISLQGKIVEVTIDGVAYKAVIQ